MWGRCGLEMARLSAAKVKAIKKSGLHGDGNGLYLRVTGSGSRVMDATNRDSRTPPGPGPRQLSGDRPGRGSRARARKQVSGYRRARSAWPNAVGQCPDISGSCEEGLRREPTALAHGKHTVNWWGSLELHAFPVIGDAKVDRIRRSDVLAVLEPIWAVRPETARRVRQRIAQFSGGARRTTTAPATRREKR